MMGNFLRQSTAVSERLSLKLHNKPQSAYQEEVAGKCGVLQTYGGLGPC